MLLWYLDQTLAESGAIEAQTATNRPHRFQGESGTPVRFTLRVSFSGTFNVKR